MSKKIRVGYLINHFASAGVETFVLNLANKLDRSIFQPYIYIALSSTKYINLLNKDVRVRYLNRKKAYGIRFFRKLNRQLREDKIQILHTNNWSTFIEGVLAKIQYPMLKSVYVQHGLEYYMLNDSSFFKNLIRKSLRIIGAKFINEMISVSKIGQNLLKNEWKSSKIKVIYNGIDLVRFGGPTQLTRNDLNLKENDFIVCSVGRLMSVKNYMCLFKAIKILKNKIPNLLLLHIGEEFEVGNKESYRLKKFVNDEKLESNFKFLGRRHDVHEILPLCDVFGLTSYSEGISLSLLEAQAAGLPAVVTNVGGNPEVVLDGHNGYLANTDDEEAVADKILTLYKNSEDRKRLGIQAKKRTHEMFSFDQMIDKYQKVYQKLLKE